MVRWRRRARRRRWPAGAARAAMVRRGGEAAAGHRGWHRGGAAGLEDEGSGARVLGGGGSVREGPARACGPAARSAKWGAGRRIGDCHVAAVADPDASGSVRTCPAAEEEILGFRGGGEIRKTGGLFIGISGARRVQMRCGFRPRDRDRTL